jgi:hypothetical protein
VAVFGKWFAGCWYIECWRGSGDRHLGLFEQRDGLFRFIKELSLAWRFLATGAMEAVLLEVQRRQQAVYLIH